MMRARPAELLPGTLRVISARINYLPPQAQFASNLSAAQKQQEQQLQQKQLELQMREMEAKVLKLESEAKNIMAKAQRE
ncbi:QueG-associated DUF1730 domain-containing protein, partial [Vibrio cholerae]|uniref:QueG-associated DUF1730 domain-containing protein n=1 Tax=Vibrio cholerae TaxID=666 RepID=UPI003F64EC48